MLVSVPRGNTVNGISYNGSDFLWLEILLVVIYLDVDIEVKADKNLRGILWILVLVLSFGGIVAFKNLWSSIWQFILMLFPIFGENIIENYLTSPYFIVGVIMAVFSGFGIYFGVKGGKVLYIIVSLVILAIDLVSIGVNIL